MSGNATECGGRLRVVAVADNGRRGTIRTLFCDDCHFKAWAMSDAQETLLRADHCEGEVR